MEMERSRQYQIFSEVEMTKVSHGLDLGDRKEKEK